MPSFRVLRHHHYCDCPSCRQFTHQEKMEGHDLFFLGREEKKGAEMGEQYFLEPVESGVRLRRKLENWQFLESTNNFLFHQIYF